MSTNLLDYDSALEFEGTIKMEPDWMILEIPQSVHDVLTQNLGVVIKPNKYPHISVVKEEQPNINQSDWTSQKFQGEKIKFKVSGKENYENGFHVWFDCYSPRLCEIREHFALPVLKKDGVYMVNFHTTVGKLVKPITPQLRKQYRLSKRTHIDVLTLMRHI